MNTSETQERIPQSAEQCLANVGAKIDRLIEAAGKAKQTLFSKEQMAIIHGELALMEMHDGLEKAWSELSVAWKDHQKKQLLEVQHEEKTSQKNTAEEDFPGTC